MDNLNRYPNGLPEDQRFKAFLFRCHYRSDAIRFIELVKSKGGYVNTYSELPFLNIWNQPVRFCDYYIPYLSIKEIEMEVLC